MVVFIFGIIIFLFSENVLKNLIILKILTIKNLPNFCDIVRILPHPLKTLLYTMYNVSYT